MDRYNDHESIGQAFLDWYEAPEDGHTFDYDDVWVCPTCRGTRTVQPDRCSPPEPCPQCVNPDADDPLFLEVPEDAWPDIYDLAAEAWLNHQKATS